MTSPDRAAFRHRILDERTAILAGRGRTADAAQAVLPPHLVCETRDRLYGLTPALVERVLPAASHPVPLLAGPAQRSVLGMASHGGLFYSLIELSQLLDPGAGGAAGPGGIMLLLRRADRRIALRVDRVLGLLALRPTGGGRHGLLPDPASGDGNGGRLVSLLDALVLRDAVASLDQDAPDRPFPTQPGA